MDMQQLADGDIPAIPYGTLTTSDIATIGINAGRAIFTHLIAAGVTSKPADLHMRAAMEVDEETAEPPAAVMIEVGEYAIGEGAAYAGNTRLDTGKLATVAEYADDTDAVAQELEVGFEENDPRGWTGGTFDTGRVTINGVLHTKGFGAACSGVEGAVDRIVSKTICAAMAAAWALDLKARYALAA